MEIKKRHKGGRAAEQFRKHSGPRLYPASLGQPSGSVIDSDAQRLQKTHIVCINSKLRIWIPFIAHTHQFGRSRHVFFIPPVESNRRLKDQENIESFLLDSGDYLCD